eukprot:gnl/Spiro4/9513_TR5039_c0_g1_i1.p1 gnl/Spiro4/9513_TR5039_c0_g1~~gnl/Spiro4/9513_TR5039_c0_g1_i1.p1  ORF type:complete len:358 (+),score=33.11 gnl/Spiro4/9513_TR5039_c0_g1_i1:29-1075(+)
MANATCAIAYPERFHLAARWVEENLLQPPPGKLDSEQALLFYALHQQATVGPNVTSKPFWWNSEERTRWECWAKLGNMGSFEAMFFYIKFLEEELGYKDWWRPAAVEKTDSAALPVPPPAPPAPPTSKIKTPSSRTETPPSSDSRPANASLPSDHADTFTFRPIDHVVSVVDPDENTSIQRTSNSNHSPANKTPLHTSTVAPSLSLVEALSREVAREVSVLQSQVVSLKAELRRERELRQQAEAQLRTWKRLARSLEEDEGSVVATESVCSAPSDNTLVKIRRGEFMDEKTRDALKSRQRAMVEDTERMLGSWPWSWIDSLFSSVLLVEEPPDPVTEICRDEKGDLVI